MSLPQTSSLLQSPLHPSASTVLPSSQTSPIWRTSSPQRGGPASGMVTSRPASAIGASSPPPSIPPASRAPASVVAGGSPSSLQLQPPAKSPAIPTHSTTRDMKTTLHHTLRAGLGQRRCGCDSRPQYARPPPPHRDAQRIAACFGPAGPGRGADVERVVERSREQVVGAGPGTDAEAVEGREQVGPRPAAGEGHLLERAAVRGDPCGEHGVREQELER